MPESFDNAPTDAAQSTFRYRVHGLVVESEIQVRELPEGGGGTPDVVIRLGSVPDSLEAAAVSGVLFDAALGQYLMRVPGVGRYLAQHGNEIIVSPAAGSTLVDVASFIGGSPMSAILHQRGVLVMHAGCLVSPSGGVLLAGHSGKGKSTTMAALAGRGHRVLADDSVVISEHPDHGLLLQPGGQRIRLWADAIRRLGYSQEGLPRVRSGLQKFSFETGAEHLHTPQPLSRIFVLETHNLASVQVTELDGSEKFAAIRRYTRMVHAVAGMGSHVSHFRLASAVASQVPITCIRRPRTADSLDEVVACLEPALR